MENTLLNRGHYEKYAQSSGLNSLLQPLGGLFTSMIRARPRSGEPNFFTRIVRLDDPSQLGGGRRKSNADKANQETGTGTGLEEASATIVALGEALERYCACVYQQDQFTWASAGDLGGEALDLDTIPRCSQAELSNPKCLLIAPDKSKPIRWVRGVSLHDGKIVQLPAVMIYTRIGYATPAERFWLPITTGCAVHYSYEQALLNAILEVIERDAISIVWLQRLPLPRIDIDCVPMALAGCWARYERALCDLEYMFFDATSDLGISTVYGLQICPAEKHLTTLVSCATALDAADAVAKNIRDMVTLRIAFRSPRQSPNDFDDFRDVFDGATYMADSERRSAFDFLIGNGRTRLLTELPGFEGDAAQGLRFVLGRLKRLGLEAYAVDLSTDEAVRAGLRAVRVVIPGLQPLSFHYRSRYLGHPRLYQAPLRMGYPVYSEEQLNHWPQPFA